MTRKEDKELATNILLKDKCLGLTNESSNMLGFL